MISWYSALDIPFGSKSRLHEKPMTDGVTRNFIAFQKDPSAGGSASKVHEYHRSCEPRRGLTMVDAAPTVQNNLEIYLGTRMRIK